MANRLIILFWTVITFIIGIVIDFFVIIYWDMQDNGYPFKPDDFLEHLVQVRMNFIEYSFVLIPKIILDIPFFRLFYALSHWIALGGIVGIIVVKLRAKATSTARPQQAA